MLEPIDFIARLAALVPPPRVPLIRYFGAFAGHYRLRLPIVPQNEPTAPVVRQVDLLTRDDNDRRTRLGWAALFRGVFAFELEDCSRGGKMRIRSAPTTPASIEPILRERGLWPDEHSRGPPSVDPNLAQLSLL